MDRPKVVRQRDVRITKTFPSGAYECSAWVIDPFGERFRKSFLYFDYTPREAVRLFLAECEALRLRRDESI